MSIDEKYSIRPLEMLPQLLGQLILLVLARVVVGQDPTAVVGIRVNPSSDGVPLRKDINELESTGGAQW